MYALHGAKTSISLNHDAVCTAAFACCALQHTHTHTHTHARTHARTHAQALSKRLKVPAIMVCKVPAIMVCKLCSGKIEAVQMVSPVNSTVCDAVWYSGNTLAAWAELLEAQEACRMLTSAQQAYEAAIAQESDAAVRTHLDSRSIRTLCEMLHLR